MNIKTFNGRIAMKHDTTSNWLANSTFIPLEGEIIVYDDYQTKEVDGKTINIPNFKIGDGLAYGIDLPWVNENLQIQLTSHINNSQIHITQSERDFWNNKITNEEEVINETLVFTKN